MVCEVPFKVMYGATGRLLYIDYEINWIDLVNKILQVFPEAGATKDIQLSYKDSDNIIIVLDSESELRRIMQRLYEDEKLYFVVGNKSGKAHTYDRRCQYPWHYPWHAYNVFTQFNGANQHGNDNGHSAQDDYSDCYVSQDKESGKKGQQSSEFFLITNTENNQNDFEGKGQNEQTETNEQEQEQQRHKWHKKLAEHLQNYEEICGPGGGAFYPPFAPHPPFGHFHGHHPFNFHGHHHHHRGRGRGHFPGHAHGHHHFFGHDHHHFPGHAHGHHHFPTHGPSHMHMSDNMHSDDENVNGGFSLHHGRPEGSWGGRGRGRGMGGRRGGRGHC
ncbi:hypothetical protein BDF19DRAFT_429004 [Syncephalis fuscata]|nr:hypothetical protein BDF19DRAFT_429004 [Syncephalis fuscata]